jgi:hypothetical protein
LVKEYLSAGLKGNSDPLGLTAGQVNRVYLVYLVHLVDLVRPESQTDQTDQINQMNHAILPTTVSVAGGGFQHMVVNIDHAYLRHFTSRLLFAVKSELFP